MKLYTLSLQAIGPFAGAHTIDLAALGQSGLFLLEGPTGAGKSTIIDAIVFALYGDLAGESASKERLHSHHAERGVEPFVDLVFEVDSGVYRVRRSPAHQRPKRRGEGTTTQNEAVTLSRVTDVDAPDAGVPISTSTQEVGHEIVESSDCARTSSCRRSCCRKASSPDSCAPTAKTAKPCCRRSSAPRSTSR
ncbi:AAA family ATPase [Aeromicrobium sp. UC242_57]|uniref:AAA family ATPase n=1 Tax=Aeromicrobium sp. UC242_57 TaxID=3374624 RepID=UPI0037A97B14